MAISDDTRPHGRDALEDVEPPVRPGQTFDRYRILEEVGRGGMGTVLRAYDPELDRDVALKLLR